MLETGRGSYRPKFTETMFLMSLKVETKSCTLIFFYFCTQLHTTLCFVLKCHQLAFERKPDFASKMFQKTKTTKKWTQELAYLRYSNETFDEPVSDGGRRARLRLDQSFNRPARLRPIQVRFRFCVHRCTEDWQGNSSFELKVLTWSVEKYV